MIKTLTKLLILVCICGFFVYLVSLIFSPIKYYKLDLKRESIAFAIPKNLDINGHTITEVRDQFEQDNKKITVAMNGGMFNPLFQPVGLTIIDSVIVQPLVTKTTGFGNFFLQPNGVFSLTRDGRASVMTTAQFATINQSDITHATQSGPMLVIDGVINPLFTVGSDNREIRNGVCVLDDDQVLFAISRRPINFYDFASFFKYHGCMNALYLDGSISKASIPSKLFNTDRNLGMVMVGYKK
jgi:uncharacterized protein YigE (DUF2233 family)